MYIKIRKFSAPNTENDLIVTISKLALISDLQQEIFKRWSIPPAKQKLYYKGKQLMAKYRIIDYNISLNDVVQIIVPGDTKPKESLVAPLVFVNTVSKYYKIGDRVDVKHEGSGAWFEGLLTAIKRNLDANDEEDQEGSSYLFYVRLYRRGKCVVSFKNIRPCSREFCSFDSLEVWQTVLLNYNPDNPELRGQWYDFKITGIVRGPNNYLMGIIFYAFEQSAGEKTIINPVRQVMKIEKPVLLENRPDDVKWVLEIRKNERSCKGCLDMHNVLCKMCGCHLCWQKSDSCKMINCEECYKYFHLYCLNPPLFSIPTGDWYCENCKRDEDVLQPTNELNVKRKYKAETSTSTNSVRDWGHGMACVGRTKECTIVPKNFFGAIPGIEVGTTWKFRVQVSEAGVHRPQVAGIHGRETEGAFSVILSGGYEDDVDYGEEFIYSGTGGRDLTGNKRKAIQSFDQQLTRMNKALAVSCNAELNEKNGAESQDWKLGKPVRVVRNYNLGKFSKYAPKEGNRYDGIYKVVRYFRKKGKSGFFIWRFLLRRDDPTPAPWAPEGKEYPLIYPPGYLEAKENEEVNKIKPKKTSKGILSEVMQENKKINVEKFSLNEKQKGLILMDKSNQLLWEECSQQLNKGKVEFLNKVQENFMCICCQELVLTPITTPCKHNMCLECIERSFAAGIYTCPCCRNDLGSSYETEINNYLSEILIDLFPGYDIGR